VASITSAFEAGGPMLFHGPPRLRGVEITAVCFEFDLSEILRPVPESPCLIQISAFDRGESIGISREPMKLDLIRREPAFGNQRLNAQKEQSTMGFYDDTSATNCRIRQYFSQFILSIRVKVDLGFFEVK